MVTLSWLPPEQQQGDPIEHYVVRVDGVSVAVVDAAEGTMQYTVTGLANAREYVFAVLAYNGQTGAAATEKATPFGAPEAPQGLGVVSDINGTVILTWSAPRNGGRSITAYYVGWSGDASGMTLLGANTRATLASVFAAGGEYAVSVRAVNEAGAGAWSAAASLMPASAPSAPRNLTSPTLVARGDGYVSLGWLPPVSVNGDAVARYVVEYKHAGESDWRRVNAAATPATVSVMVRNLQNGTLYSFRVLAVNRAGESAPSNVTTNRPARAPDAPRNVQVVVGEVSVTVSWEKPGFDGGEPIIAYTVEYGTVGGGTTTMSVPVTDNTQMTFSVFLQTLAAGRRYEVKVYAANTVGRSRAAGDVSEAQVVAAQVGAALVGNMMSEWGRILAARVDVAGAGGGGGAQFNVLGSQIRVGGGAGGGLDWRENNLPAEIARFLKSHGGQLAGGEFSGKDLRDSSFDISFGGAGKGAGAGVGLAGAGGGGNKWGVWGRATYGGSELSGGEVESEGKTRGAYLGADAQVGENVVLGVMLSHNRADSDYTFEGRAGEFAMRASGVHPYLSWRFLPHSNLWLSGGQSEGETETTPANGETTKQDLVARLFAGGINQNLYVWRGEGGDSARLNLRIDGAIARSEMGETRTDHKNARVLFELRHIAGEFQPFVEGGWRYAANGNGGSNAQGWEASGGLRYSGANGWLWELTGGGSQMRGGDRKYSSWELGALLRKNAAANGSGWSFSLSPQYAPAKTSAMPTDIWGGFAPPEEDAGERVLSVKSELSYGWLGAGALWTPYLGATYSAGDASALRLGAKWESRARADFALRANVEILREREKTAAEFRLLGQLLTPPPRPPAFGGAALALLFWQNLQKSVKWRRLARLFCGGRQRNKGDGEKLAF